MPGQPPSSAGLPIACGAIGDFDPDAVERMLASLDANLGEAHRDERAVLMLDREPVGWAGERARGVGWGERLPVRADGARSAAEAAAAGVCGLVLEGERRSVHASVSGIGPVYWTRHGDATYFSTAIDPLVAVLPQLEPDWRSWAQILALGYVCGTGTPFAGISRLEPLARLTDEGDGVPREVRGGLAWAEVDPEGAEGVPERVVAALREEIAALDPRLSVVCPLSGGLDSRLLASLLVERGLDVETWTVDPEWGHDREQELAAAVAGRLGVPHRTVPTDGRPFEDEIRETARLLEHESMLHLALARLGPALPPGPGVVVDGLGGDVFLNSKYATAEVVGTPGWRPQAELLLDRFVPERTGLPLFEARAWQSLRETARASYLSEAERFAGHPASAALSIYWNRTRRGISASPVRLFGARRQVAMPFIADGVVRAGLLAPPAAKLDGRFYGRMLELVNSDVARLPSSRDEGAEPPRTRPRRSRSREARNVYLSLLERSPLRPWFGAELERAVSERRLGPVIRKSWWRGARVQTLSSLTLWFERYADVIEADLAPGAAPWAR